MVEIKFKGTTESADLSGLTLSEARDQFKHKLGIPNKAVAWLNGKKISSVSEIDTVLHQNDILSFAAAKSRRTLIMVGAAVLALIVTGAVFARGFINSSATLSATAAASNFADVIQNPDISNISWTEIGMTKSSIAGPHSLFNIIPADGFTGDIGLTVTLANANQLIKYYRNLNLKLQLVHTSDNSTVDINDDGFANANDWVMLTLNNATVNIEDHTTGNVTIRLLGGSYASNAAASGSGSATPQLFCEVKQ
jgi:hypothetical protein